MRMRSFVVCVALTALLLLGAAGRTAVLLSAGADIEWWTVGAGVLGLLGLFVSILAAPTLRRPRKR